MRAIEQLRARRLNASNFPFQRQIIALDIDTLDRVQGVRWTSVEILYNQRNRCVRERKFR
jgi:hypothetical protein